MAYGERNALHLHPLNYAIRRPRPPLTRARACEVARPGLERAGPGR